MSELEKDIEDWKNKAEHWESTTIPRSLIRHLTALGYTRAGLTEAQREAVEKLRKAWENFEPDGCITEVERVLKAFDETEDATPKPARRVVQVALAASSYGSWPLALCDDGTLWGMPDGTSDDGIWKKLPPIPGDDA